MIRYIQFLLIAALSTPVYANIASTTYEVLDFIKVSERHYEIKLQEFYNKEVIYNVLLRFRPECFSRMDYGTTIAQEEKMFDSAITLLKSELEKSHILSLGRKSGTGFIKSPSNSNFFEAESLRVVNTGVREFVYFQHSDIGFGACNNA